MQDDGRTKDIDPNRSEGGLRTTQHFYRVDRRDISFLRFILEAYDGMAVVTTLNAALGIVSLTVAPGCDDVVAAVLESLAAEGEIYMEPLAAGEVLGYGQESLCTSFT